MSSKGSGTKKILSKIWSEDIKVIGLFLLALVSIWNIYAMGLGWISAAGLPMNTPSISITDKVGLPDSDGDLLPDLIETTPKGVEIIAPNGHVIGIGTGTDPNKKDTDGDLFTDAAEDNLGTDPNNWFSPGYIYLIWLFALGVFLFNKYREKDLLKEYQEFDNSQSSGVSGESKFAHGGTSVFGQKTAKLSEEDKKKLIQSDARFHRMTGEGIALPPKRKPKRHIKKLVFKGAIILLIVFLIQYLRNDSA